MSNIIRVVLADDHVFVRDGIKSLLENEANIEVVGEAIDGADALEVVADNQTRFTYSRYPYAKLNRYRSSRKT